MKNVVVRFVREDAGQDLIEYAMLAALFALVAGVTAETLGTNLAGWYSKMTDKVTTWSNVPSSVTTSRWPSRRT